MRPITNKYAIYLSALTGIVPALADRLAPSMGIILSADTLLFAYPAIGLAALMPAIFILTRAVATHTEIPRRWFLRHAVLVAFLASLPTAYQYLQTISFLSSFDNGFAALLLLALLPFVAKQVFVMQVILVIGAVTAAWFATKKAAEAKANVASEAPTADATSP